MRFFSSGPSIPDSLLEERDRGNVVFFCGAGISQPAGLPGFLDLAERVNFSLGSAKGSAVSDLLERIRTNPSYAPPLDQVFSTLQQVYGAAAIDDAVAQQLKIPRNAYIGCHSIVLRLSLSAKRRPQVVTTNFDRLFEKANRATRVHVPPALPDLASGQPMEGIVYLHGRAPVKPPGGIARQGFVLSSADFGRAYLADGWATRFARELLQRYVIVLLGYSATDPPVRYLLEGLHARDDAGTLSIYAFDQGDEDEVRDRWRDRGVTPLAYPPSDRSHSSLWDTLEAWAERADDPDAWRRKVVSKALSGPRALEPYERGQVASLVSTDVGAKLFANFETLPPAEWLCVFDQFIRRAEPRKSVGEIEAFDPLLAYGLDDDPPRTTDPSLRDTASGSDFLSSVAGDRREASRSRLAGSIWPRWGDPMPPRLLALAGWIANVIDEPATAGWAAGYRALHPALCDQIEWRLERSGKDVHERAYRAWALLLEQYRNSPEDDHDSAWFQFAPKLKREGWSTRVCREFERVAKPYLRSKRPFHTFPCAPQAGWPDVRMSDVVSFDVEFPLEHAGEIDVPSDDLAGVVRALRRGLEHGAGLLSEVGTSFWQTTTFHPEDRPGEHYLDDKDHYLLRFIRLFDRLVKERRPEARNEVLRWIRRDRFFFDKLTIYAAMKPEIFSAHECASRILELSSESLWDSHSAREVLHTLRARWHELSKKDRHLLEARILEGPNQWRGEEIENYARRKAIDAATMLGWLRHHGCSLSKETAALLPKLREADPRWQPSWDLTADDSHEGRVSWVKIDTDPAKIIDAPLPDLIQRVQEFTTHSFGEFTEYRPFVGLVQNAPFRALSLLSFEARHQRYPIHLWQNTLSYWPAEASDRLQRLLLSRLVRLPPDKIFELRYDAPNWLQKNLLKLAKASQACALQGWDALFDLLVAAGAEAFSSPAGDAFVGGRPQLRSRRTYEHSINSPMGRLLSALFEILVDQI